MKKNKRMNNNGKFSPAHKNEILQCYRDGIETKDHICSYVGIHHNTLNNWIKEGKITEAEILRVQLENKVKAINTIMEAMKSSRIDVALRAAQWWLERKYPQEYSSQYEERQVRLIINNLIEKIVDIVKLEVADPEVIKRIAEGLKGVYV